MASAMIGNLAVSLTMQTAAFQRGATIAEKRTEAMRGRFAAATTSVKGLGTALGVTIGADVLYRITSSAFEMASSLQEAAEQVGVTVEGLQELRFAAEQTGVGTDKIEAAIKRLNRSLGDLQLGKTAAVDAFSTIGLSADDLRGKKPDEALRLIADALNKLPDASQRVAIGQQLMGRSFSDLLPLINGGSQALEQFAEASRRNGQISTEDAQKLDELADQWAEMKTQVGVATATFLADAIPALQAVGRALDATKKFFWDLGVVIRGMPSVVLQAMAEMVQGIQTWLGDRLSAIFDGAKRKIAEVKQAFFDMWTAVTRRSYVPDMVADIGKEMGSLDRVMVQPALTAVETVARAFMRLTESVHRGGILGILEGLAGVALQLGSLGLFGGKIAANINNPGGFGGAKGFVSPPGGGGGGAARVEIYDTTGLFAFKVNGQIMAASPGLVNASGKAAVATMGYRQSRSLGG